ncbi:MAG TPA: cell division protein FtsQ/DivIB [Burkholderiaceae bacterium]|nr:cell division protein FtsQ/DivIB [Burkholderiaceae bacterium]
MAAATASRTALPADIRLMNATAAVLAALGGLALVAAALVWIARQPVFAFHDIRVEGDIDHNNALTIRANAAPRLSGSFFTIDLGAARRAFESVPWVRHAVVRRVWPNRLAVRLEEHRVAALWGMPDGADKLVNSFGEVFEANLGDVEDRALPTLRGPEGSSARMLAMLTRLDSAFAALEGHVEALDLSERGSWRAKLDSGAEIELGRGTDDEVVARAQRFVGTVPQVTQRYGRALESADLRHNDGYAVRLQGVSTGIDPGAKPGKK